MSVLAVAVLLLSVSAQLLLGLNMAGDDEISRDGMVEIKECNRAALPYADIKEIEQTKDVHILMSVSESILLWRYLHLVDSYVEYGAGGSTILACKSTVKHIFTIEADAEFLIDLVSKSTDLQEAIVGGRMQGEYVNIGPVTDFSIPVDRTMEQLWSNYANHIFDAKFIPQLVLVDGRFRVASALTALLVLKENNGLLMFHDFFNRPHYYVILDFVDVIDCVDTLLVARRRANVTDEAIKVVIEQYHHVYD